MKKKIYFMAALAVMGSQVLYGQNFWKKTKISERNVIESKRNIGADYTQVYTLDINQLKSVLQNAPVSETGIATRSTVIIDLPDLEGKFEKYTVYEISNMAPELAARFPDIKSYRGVSVNDPGKTISFALSQNGLKLIMFAPDKKPVIIEPATKDASVYLVSPAVPNTLPDTSKFECSVEERNVDNTTIAQRNTNDRRFRTFRLAVSADGEFSTFHGGTTASALAAINDIMSVINPVYERDLSIHMNLVANNDQIIFLDSATDPYTIPGYPFMNNQTQLTIMEHIGEANYDLGILLSGQNTGGGNAGMIASVCQDSEGDLFPQFPGLVVDKKKGSAYMGNIGEGPTGFVFAMATAHEMGHQFGANHTFSKSESTGANLEPGSGITIMGYPGVTGTHDVADKFNDQFLHHSINQINAYITTTSCATTVDMANHPPTVNAGSDYTIPKGTAFKLTATASDPDNNPLTYSWEEADLSVSTGNSFPDRNSATTPNFRVYSPTSSPTRYFPPLPEVLDGSLYSTWNMISDVARNMKFVSLVRDNAPEGGQTASDEAVISIDAGTGPFKITSLSLNQNYPSGSSHLLKWDIAGTNAAPINTSSVNILISTDGGTTFTPLISNTPNDGEETITIPSTSSQKAYIIVESVGNVYYAASPAFAIDYNVTLNCTQYPAAGGPFAFTPGRGNHATMDINIPVTAAIEDINMVIDLNYTDIGETGLVLVDPYEPNKQSIFWLGSCSGSDTLRATFDQEGSSQIVNCNNLNSNPTAKIEPIRLDLSRYYGRNPNGNWKILAAHTSSLLNNVQANNTSGTVNSAAIELCTRQAVSTLAVNDVALEKDGFQVYPNPSNGRFSVLMKKNTPTDVQIFDMGGRLIQTQSGITNDSKIDLTGFAKGNYIMVFNVNGKKVAKKVIIK
ncbi:MAG: M12 family metallo-peptidase [Chryseobacterium sp.]|jgi:hypothetical protein|uniref:reprolysin-like metallopeptidase n=1 Tax=Chryseobacterium sp. TaxID=1871047 RepID=UPI00281DE2AC|nr:zinc-dependent metalloprotease family protein [Chryseobacterium sp.]MDR2238749.1 M12 family metallo-peptidase [Chryseobacterium sp.]